MLGLLLMESKALSHLIFHDSTTVILSVLYKGGNWGIARWSNFPSIPKDAVKTGLETGQWGFRCRSNNLSDRCPHNSTTIGLHLIPAQYWVERPLVNGRVQCLRCLSEKPPRDLTRPQSGGTLYLTLAVSTTGKWSGGTYQRVVRTHASVGFPLGTGERAGHASRTRFSELGTGRRERARGVRAGPSDVGAGGRLRLA